MIIPLPPKQLWDSCLREHGTDVELNHLDPQGDGDQSSLGHLEQHAKQFYRNWFASGVDMENLLLSHRLSPFMEGCIYGQYDQVKKALESVDEANEAAVPDELVALLETRETSNRMSPLLILVSMGKGLPKSSNETLLAEKQIKTAELLLQYGARPDVKDICGKTVCHYGAGMMATDMTMAVVDMCIAAAKSSYLFGKKVQLMGLKKEDMNGKLGIARGYSVGTGRRIVRLLSDPSKAILVKPENLQLVDETAPKISKLCDVPDRLGAVSMHEVLIKDRHDVAEFLLHQHEASLDIVDGDGFSVRKLWALPGSVSVSPKVAIVIKKHVEKQAIAELKAEKRQCGRCGAKEKDESRMLLCARCKTVRYCCKGCQVTDWKTGGHKQACKILDEERNSGILLEKTKPPKGHVMASICNHTGRTTTTDGTFRKPNHVKVGEKFYIKVQRPKERGVLIIYDKSRQMQVLYPEHLRGYNELNKKVLETKAFKGAKAYMKASFDAQGNCTVYPGTTTIKTW